MKINWLGTAALTFALGIGGGAVVAQPEQLKEPQLHERNQSARRGQEQPDRGEYTAASLAQQSQDEQRAREAQEAADAKRQSIREELQEQDNRVAGTAEPEGSRISLSSEQREMLKQAAQSSLTVGSTSGGGSGQTCVTLRRVPDDLARSNPDLAGYRYVAIGDQIVLVDPRRQKIVDVIE